MTRISAIAIVMLLSAACHANDFGRIYEAPPPALHCTLIYGNAAAPEVAHRKIVANAMLEPPPTYFHHCDRWLAIVADYEVFVWNPATKLYEHDSWIQPDRGIDVVDIWRRVRDHGRPGIREFTYGVH